MGKGDEFCVCFKTRVTWASLGIPVLWVSLYWDPPLALANGWLRFLAGWHFLIMLSGLYLPLVSPLSIPEDWQLYVSSSSSLSGWGSAVCHVLSNPRSLKHRWSVLQFCPLLPSYDCFLGLRGVKWSPPLLVLWHHAFLIFLNSSTSLQVPPPVKLSHPYLRVSCFLLGTRREIFKVSENAKNIEPKTLENR